MADVDGSIPLAGTDPLVDPSNDGASTAPDGYMISIIVTNSLSTFACLFVLVTYILLWRKYPRLLSRLSLRLSAAMAAADLILHASNLAGYGDLPTSAACQVVGGFMFAFPSLLSLFYACSIALNCQLVFVAKKQPGADKQKYSLLTPFLVALLICIPTLAAGLYGYDKTLQYCWYATANVEPHILNLRILFTFDLWCFIAVVYLAFAAITIISAVFSKHDRMSQLQHSMDGEVTLATETVARRDAARRALTIRLLGCIFVPILCVVPAIILDILTKRGIASNDVVNGIFDGINGLMGTFNAILFGCDPAVLAIAHAMRERGAAKSNSDIPLSFKQAASATDSTTDKLSTGGIMVHVEVTRHTDGLAELEHDLYGL